MNFTFEAIRDLSLIEGSYYLMDFGEQESQQDAAMIEGKLLTVFGEPVESTENSENSFLYVIRATADDGAAVILSVYGTGLVHIGAKERDLAKEAATALIEHVHAATPANFSRTVYYLDFLLQIDISVQDGVATVRQSQIPEEKAAELFSAWY